MIFFVLIIILISYFLLNIIQCISIIADFFVNIIIENLKKKTK